MLHPQEFIEQIQQRIQHSDWEFALDGYAGSIDRLLTITQIRTVIPFRKWWENAKEGEFKAGWDF